MEGLRRGLEFSRRVNSRLVPALADLETFVRRRLLFRRPLVVLYSHPRRPDDGASLRGAFAPGHVQHRAAARTRPDTISDDMSTAQHPPKESQMKPTMAWGWMLTAVLLVSTPPAFGAFDWSAGPWGVVIGSNGSPGSGSCPMDYPGGTKMGNALAIHYQRQPTNVPQLWVFLTDGFWRQTSAQSQFLTSSPTLDGTWSNVAAGVTGPSFGPLPLAPGFLRIAQTEAP